MRLWDVSAGEQVARLTGHTDYVRAAAASPTSSDTWATGAPPQHTYTTAAPPSARWVSGTSGWSGTSEGSWAGVWW